MASPSPDSSAFLLSQLGVHASMQFLERAAALDLSGPLVSVLRTIAEDPGTSQQALAQRLDILPSRIVAFVDDLEAKGLVRRERHVSDRRTHALRMTELGEQRVEELRVAGREHGEQLFAALSEQESATLRELLGKIAAEQGLAPGVHPGFRHLSGR